VNAVLTRWGLAVCVVYSPITIRDLLVFIHSASQFTTYYSHRAILHGKDCQDTSNIRHSGFDAPSIAVEHDSNALRDKAESEEMINNKAKPFSYRFVNDGSNVLLELTNATKETLKSVEILTVFLKNEEGLGVGPSQVHIRFEAVERILPSEKSILAHTTLINGKPAELERDQLQRLQAIDGRANPYVLDISWQDAEGKTRFQRIPVGH